MESTDVVPRLGESELADSDEQERMTQLRNCPRGWADEPVLEQLTKPKARDKK